MYVHPMCTVSMEARRGCPSSWQWSFRWLWVLCGWWESILGPSQEQQRGHWNKTQVNRGHYCWDSFQCQLLGYRYRCYLRYTACVHMWLPLPNSFLICQVEITTASLLGALGQLREMVPIKPLTYGCRMSASESLLWNELLYAISLIKDITITSLRITFFIINSIVNAWVLFFSSLGRYKVLRVELLAVSFLWRLFSLHPGPSTVDLSQCKEGLSHKQNFPCPSISKMCF